MSTEMKPRQLKEVIELLRAGDSLSVSKLSESLDLKIKERTLRADVQSISSYCAAHGVIVRRKEGSLFIMASPEARRKLETEVRALLEEQPAMSPQERIRKIICRCLTAPIIPTLDQWSEELGVSRPSIVKDIKAVKEWLAARNLSLTGKTGVGYTLEYREFDWRNAVVRFLLPGNENKVKKWIAANKPDETWEEFSLLYPDFDFTPINQFIARAENRTKARMMEPDLLAFVLYTGIAIMRDRLGKKIALTPEQLGLVLKSDEYQAVKEEICVLEKAYAVDLPAEETAYLALSYICAKKNRAEQSPVAP